MTIRIFTRKGEEFVIENVDYYKIHNCGPGLLTIQHDENRIEYFRLGYINHWTVIDAKGDKL